MIILGDPINKSLSGSLAEKLSCPIIYPEVTIFPDSEQRVRIDSDKVRGETVFLVKSIDMPVDSAVTQLAFLVDALIRSGADKIIGIVPYIPYMRADHVFRSGEASPLQIIIKIIEASGLSEIVIVDPHSIKIPEQFTIQVHNLSAIDLFVEKIKSIESARDSITIISPDMGGVRRLELLDERLGGVNKVIINKDRDYSTGELKVAEVKGEVFGTCFIVDDIISTGETISQAVETLTYNGASDVYVLATHAVFSGDAVKILSDSKAARIFVTDSIPITDDKLFEKLEIISIASLVASKLV